MTPTKIQAISNALGDGEWPLATPFTRASLVLDWCEMSYVPTASIMPAHLAAAMDATPGRDPSDYLHMVAALVAFLRSRA